MSALMVYLMILGFLCMTIGLLRSLTIPDDRPPGSMPETFRRLELLWEKASALVRPDPFREERSPIEPEQWRELLPAHISPHCFQELRNIVNDSSHERYENSEVQFRVEQLREGLIVNREKNSKHISREIQGLGFQVTQGQVKEVYDYLVRNADMPLQREAYMMLKSLSDRTATTNDVAQFIYYRTEIEAWKQHLSVGGFAGPASLGEMLHKREALRTSDLIRFQEHTKQVRSQAAMAEFEFMATRFREISPEPLSPTEIAALDPINCKGRQFIRIDEKMLFQHFTEERVKALRASSILLFVRQANQRLRPLSTLAEDAVRRARTQVLYRDAHLPAHIDNMPPPQRELPLPIHNLYASSQELPIDLAGWKNRVLEMQWEVHLTDKQRELFPEIVRLQQDIEYGSSADKERIINAFHQEFLSRKADTIAVITDYLNDAGFQFLGKDISVEQVCDVYTYHFENQGTIFQPKTYMMMEALHRDKAMMSDIANFVQSLKEVQEWKKTEFNYLGLGIEGSDDERQRWQRYFGDHYRWILSNALLAKYEYLANGLNKDFESRGIIARLSALEVAASDPLTLEGQIFIYEDNRVLHTHPNYPQWEKKGDQYMPSSSQGGTSLDCTCRDMVRLFKVKPFQRGACPASEARHKPGAL